MSANVPTPEKAAKELLGEDADQLDSFREIGVGYALAKSGTPYWCAIFAKPVRPAPRLPQIRGPMDAQVAVDGRRLGVFS